MPAFRHPSGRPSPCALHMLRQNTKKHAEVQFQPSSRRVSSAGTEAGWARRRVSDGLLSEGLSPKEEGSTGFSSRTRSCKQSQPASIAMHGSINNRKLGANSLTSLSKSFNTKGLLRVQFGVKPRTCRENFSLAMATDLLRYVWTSVLSQVR
jgi:hypothetical protein